MKKFYINVVIYFIIFFLIMVGFDYLSMQSNTRTLIAKITNSNDYLTGYAGVKEMLPYIEKARAQDATTKLIIGDSVCRQMFTGLQEYNDDFSIIGSVAAITMTGQYILTKEYLDNHTNATDVYLFVLPQSLGNTFDTTWGYQYIVMPFVDTDTLKYLDQDTIDIMASVYGEIFLDPKIVTAIENSGLNQKLYLNTLKKYAEGHILQNHFELADNYVYKMYEMCEERGVKFHLYPSPVSEKKREYVNDLIGAFKKSKIYSINPEYLDMVYYYPAEQTEDGVHFSSEYAIQSYYNEIIMEEFRDNELLDNLKLE